MNEYKDPVEDINNILSRYGEELVPVEQEVPYIEETGGWIDDTLDAPTKVRWTPNVAVEHANKLQLATDLNDQEAAGIAQQLVASGGSTTNTQLTARIEAEDKEERINGVAAAVPEIGVESAAQAVQDILTSENEYALDDAVISQAFVTSESQSSYR